MEIGDYIYVIIRSILLGTIYIYIYIYSYKQVEIDIKKSKKWIFFY